MAKVLSSEAQARLPASAYRYCHDEEWNGDDLYAVCGGKFCKIGRTNNIAQRLTSLQNGCPYDLQVVMLIKGHGWQEHVWHAAFRHLHVRGEWHHQHVELGRAIRAANVGDEWIATLTCPRSLDWARKQDVYALCQFIDGEHSAGDDADFVWRDHIADLEEIAADKEWGLLPAKKVAS